MSSGLTGTGEDTDLAQLHPSQLPLYEVLFVLMILTNKYAVPRSESASSLRCNSDILLHAYIAANILLYNLDNICLHGVNDLLSLFLSFYFVLRIVFPIQKYICLKHLANKQIFLVVCMTRLKLSACCGRRSSF